jgi:hypothetical protein
MSTGQTMLTVAAMVLLGLTVLNVNKNMLNNGTVMRHSEIAVYAVSFATSVIEKACGLHFDEQSKDSAAIGIGSFTAPSLLNPEAGETTEALFDDFDDYNNFAPPPDTVKGVSLFWTIGSVYYVAANTPDTKSNIATYYKRLDVKVFSELGNEILPGGYLVRGDTIQMSYIMGYYKW